MSRTTVALEDLTANSSPADFEAVLEDQENVKKLVAEKRFGKFVKDYADAKIRDNTDLMAQVKAQVQLNMAEWLKDNKAEDLGRLNLSPDDTIAPLDIQKAKVYNPRALGAALDKDFRDAADYLTTIWHLNDRHDPDISARQSKIKNALSSDVPSEGGFLVPERLRAELLRVALETSIVRPRARVIPMDSLRVPFPAIDASSNVSSVYGGVTAFWTEESAALQESKPAFSRVVLDAKKLTAYTEVPNELMSDSIISLQAFISEIFPEAIGYFEDLAFLNGSGVGEPLGVLKSNALILAERATNDKISWADVTGMYARMLPGSLGRAVWIASIDTFPQLASMELATGSPATWINNGLSDGPPMTLLGRPVIFTEKVPGLGNQSDLSFIDFGYYLLGDRQAMTARSSEDYKFRNDQTAFRFIERVDGRPWLHSAITPHNGSATLSPYVTLEGDD